MFVKNLLLGKTKTVATVGKNVVNLTQKRTMASEKQIKDRMTSTEGINKITKTMKMVSASKMKGDEARLKSARPFQSYVTNIAGEAKLWEDWMATSGDLPEKNTLVTLFSDKGLCGGVNTGAGRAYKSSLPGLMKKGKDFKIFIIGEKGRAQLTRVFAEQVVEVNSDAVTPYTFSLASSIAQGVVKEPADQIHVAFNSFRSAIAYELSVVTIEPFDQLAVEPFMEYEFEPDTKNEVLQDLSEFATATTIYTSLMENAASEQSSRMNAMENASQNGEELLKDLSIEYNRARQARITTELVEIISGASAL